MARTYLAFNTKKSIDAKLERLQLAKTMTFKEIRELITKLNFNILNENEVTIGFAIFNHEETKEQVYRLNKRTLKIERFR